MSPATASPALDLERIRAKLKKQPDGGAMFRGLFGCDEKRELLADQLARFERVRNTVTNTT